MTKKQILTLRPEFKLNEGMSMIDWYETSEGDSFFSIRSGLRHADGITKSPYYYSECVVSANAKRDALKNFAEWWKNMKI